MRQFPSARIVAGLLLLAAGQEPLVAHDKTTIPAVDKCLAARVFGQSPQGPIDLVAARIAAGEWAAPAEGDMLPLPNGQSLPWTTITAADGKFEHELLQGGYASFPIESPVEQVMVLQIHGRHLAVYVNGRPRVGNVYDHGHVKLPVLLREGTNELLVQGMAGSLGVSLERPGSDAVLNTADTTLPDLLVGKPTDALAAVTVINATNAPLAGLQMQASGDGLETTVSDLPVIAPLTVRKVPFRIAGPAPAEGGQVAVTLRVIRNNGDAQDVLNEANIQLDIRQAGEPYRQTFLSGIDNSVQYYAVTPADPVGDSAERPALFLTLHGASVEAIGQARAYSSKSWGHIVAPTNRSIWGFDWEDWGRLDALEVLADAQQRLGTDPRRTYLTGHSMGGHGTWQIGATYPDRFAAIGPSAGWISFSTYAGNRDQQGSNDPVSELFQRATSPSDTLSLIHNHLQQGVYILHGADDDNVPVDQARRMRQELATFHQDVSFHEEPGKGHWWNLSDEPGADCVDWAPMFDMFARHVIPTPDGVRDINFTAASPGISARCQWCEILAQQRQLQLANVEVRFDPGLTKFSGKTINVARLAFDAGLLAASEQFTIELDGQTLGEVKPPDRRHIYLERVEDEWRTMPSPPPGEKGPHRYGTFKDAFRNRMQFVYGTQGDDAENGATYDKARLDAEAFWYQGNGSVELIADQSLDPAADPDRNVILYGNADTNSAWDALLTDCPVHVARGALNVGERTEQGDDLVCLLIRPRPGSEVASVGAVAASGVTGMRMSAQIVYLRSRAAYPDWTVFRAAGLPGHPAVIGTGYFGLDWGLTTGETGWR